MSPVILTAAGCTTAIKSQRLSGPTDGADGLIYHLPKRDILLTVTVNSGKRTPSVDRTASFADPRSTFLLNLRRSPVAKSELHLHITTEGLITQTVDVTQTAQVSDILKAAVGSAVAVGGRHANNIAPPPDIKCTADGTYTLLIDPYNKGDLADVVKKGFCGIGVQITPANQITGVRASAVDSNRNDCVKPDDIKDKASCPTANGIYYRQNTPFLVQLTDSSPTGGLWAFLVLLPNQDQVSLLSVPTSLFADNTSSLAFDEGIPSEYHPQRNSELVGVLKIPADVVGEYFAAVGRLFDAFSSNRQKEANANSELLTLKLQQYKTDQCLKALSTQKSDAIDAACNAK